MSLSKQVSIYWNEYLAILEKKPIQTKATTAAILSVVSDVLAQRLQGKSWSQLSGASIRNQFIIGLLIRGPLVHYWYILLEALFQRLGLGGKQHAGKLSTAVAKVVVDQTTWSPFFNVLYFFVIGFLEGKSMSFITSKIGREFPIVMRMNYKIWPLVNLVNFALVPPKLRVLFGNVVAIFWTTFLILATKGK